MALLIKMQDAIIIFVRNATAGKVKTRLAATIGHRKALTAYKLLIEHTYQLIAHIDTPVYVYYSELVEEEDIWQGDHIVKHLQWGDDLGRRMKHAFRDVFSIGHDRVIIIGSDCYELTTEMLMSAFLALRHHDAVIGPATDGGYYLLGLSKFIPDVFDDIPWSTDEVTQTTIATLQRAQHSCSMLPMLTDVDEEKDLPAAIARQL